MLKIAYKEGWGVRKLKIITDKGGKVDSYKYNDILLIAILM